jgi:hypothetical protein
MNRQKTQVLALLLCLALLAVAGSLFAASRIQLASELLQVLMILVGMLAMATISVFHSLIERISEGALTRVSFNSARTRESLTPVIDAEVIGIRDDDKRRLSPWEPTDENLLLQDPTLALAKLRIDIERELRRLAFDSELKVDTRRISVNQLLSALAQKKIIPYEAVSAINDILPLCNQAIHGADIDAALAQSVLAIGTDLVALLKRKNFAH